MGELHYLIGDASKPEHVDERPVIIAHVCNDQGGWGSGFVVALSKRDVRPEQMYRRSRAGSLTPLGEVYVSLYDPSGRGGELDIFVANMVAQHGYKSKDNPVPLSYRALWECLLMVGEEAADMDATVHMPRIGCGLGGGEWAKVERIVRRALAEIHGRDVYVYDLPTPDAIEDHHLMDEGDKKFQDALHELAERSSAHE